MKPLSIKNTTKAIVLLKAALSIDDHSGRELLPIPTLTTPPFESLQIILTFFLVGEGGGVSKGRGVSGAGAIGVSLCLNFVGFSFHPLVLSFSLYLGFDSTYKA